MHNILRSLFVRGELLSSNGISSFILQLLSRYTVTNWNWATASPSTFGAHGIACLLLCFLITFCHGYGVVFEVTDLWLFAFNFYYNYRLFKEVADRRTYQQIVWKDKRVFAYKPYVFRNKYTYVFHQGFNSSFSYLTYLGEVPRISYATPTSQSEVVFCLCVKSIRVYVAAKLLILNHERVRYLRH